MKKIYNYINEEKLKVDIEILGEINDDHSFNVEYVFIENGVRSEYTMKGYMINNELYRSFEEYYYDDKMPMITM